MRWIILLLISSLQADLHVFTYANKPHQGLCYLSTSCQEQNIDLQLIGMESINGPPLPGRYKNHMTKLVEFSRELKKRDILDDDLVLFVDAFDVLVLSNEEAITKSFLSFGKEVVVGAEKVFTHIQMRRQRPLHPPSPTSFIYLNSGAYIGYKKSISDLLEWCLTHSVGIDARNDQPRLTGYFLEYQDKVALDYHNEIILNCYQVTDNELEVDPLLRTVRVKETGNSPHVIHGNGKAPVFTKMWIDFFGYK